MLTDKRIIGIITIGLIIFTSLKSQYTMNSPYSRFYIGDIEPEGFVINRSMGGTGVAMQIPNIINYMNPASYTTQDTLSFIWDISLKGSFTQYRTSTQQLRQRNFNFNHLAFSACMSKNIYLSAGLIPYSKTGYDYIEYYQFPDSELLKNEYLGNGNINRFYIGNAYSIFNKRLSFGLNISYLFGQIKNQTYVNLVNAAGEDYGFYTVNTQDLSLNGWIFTLGAQWKLYENSSFIYTLGVTYELTTHLSVDKIIFTNRSSDTLAYSENNDMFKIPGRLCLGINVVANEKFNFSTDFSMQDWTKSSLFSSTDSFQKYQRVSVGIEYVKNKQSLSNYFDKVRYRLGFHYENTYLRIRNEGINDYGLSFGIGLPLKRANSFINIGYEIGRRGTLTNQLIEDNYHRIFFSLSLYDFWFYKRKYD